MPTRFIPLSRREIVTALGDDPELRRVATMLHHTMRFEADDASTSVHRLYQPFDPDPVLPGARTGDPASFLRAFDRIMEDANFRRVSQADLEAAFEERSLFPLHAEVDLDDYDVLRLYRRGLSRRVERYRNLSTLYRWRKRELVVYDRLVVVLRLKDEALAGKRTMRMEGMQPGKIYLKSFKDIPTADVEMVLPNTELRLRKLDRLLVGGPLAAGVGATLFNSISIFVALLTGAVALSLESPQIRALGGVLVVLAGYLWRTHAKIKSTRLKYLRTLSSGLYFRNLANNAAVVDQMLTMSQNEEEKEALIAYALLQDGARSQRRLDEDAEAWLKAQTGLVTDFDVADGIDSLQRLGLVEKRRRRWTALPPDEAMRRLDARWDAAF